MAISYDPRSTVSEFAEAKGIEFPLLSDSGSATIKAYGLLNEEATSPRVKGIPHPGTLIVDATGKIRAKLFFDGYKKRHTADAILEAFGELPKE